MGARSGSELDQGQIEVAGVRRSYWLARAPRPRGEAAPPLLMALHGSGMDGRGMASFTGLGPARPRGRNPPPSSPMAGRVPGTRHGRRPGSRIWTTRGSSLRLATHLEGLGAARSWPVFLAGISQGARYAEHVARNGLLPVTGLFLVAGTALEVSRRMVPVPELRASMVLVMGTGDPTTPYEGGRLTRRGISGRILKRRAVKHGELPGEDIVAGAEEVVADWAAANRITAPGSMATRSPPPAASPYRRSRSCP